ncbi:MAG: hypothetical protein NC311_01785 [Muribaculaceae bacterium]|nr:hypothetical protein [Muribaculaceae bacterium]
MKNKIILYTAGGLMLNIPPAFALSWVNPSECVDCRDPIDGTCTQTGIGCCDPCAAIGGEIKPVTCDESTCSGQTVSDGDTCTQTETMGCQNLLCQVVSTTVQCKKGYYGMWPSYDSDTKTCSGCTRCPAKDGYYGTTWNAGAITATSCYLPSGTPFSDATGTGIYGSDCYWAG